MTGMTTADSARESGPPPPYELAASRAQTLTLDDFARFAARVEQAAELAGKNVDRVDRVVVR